MSIRDEIAGAVTRLAISSAEFAAVPSSQARVLLASFLARFTGGHDAPWWWEHFVAPTTSVQVSDGSAFSRIAQIVPDARAKVWFVAEDDDGATFPVYDATPEAAQRVLGECYAFEYYLIAKDLSWLLCESHHNILFGIGDPLHDRMPTGA